MLSRIPSTERVQRVFEGLREQRVVAVLGARQVTKTTLARQVVDEWPRFRSPMSLFPAFESYALKDVRRAALAGGRAGRHAERSAEAVPQSWSWRVRMLVRFTGAEGGLGHEVDLEGTEVDALPSTRRLA